ncbi:MAG TPA: hypothetical protein VGC30_13995 [Dokdonella sp.]
MMQKAWTTIVLVAALASAAAAAARSAAAADGRLDPTFGDGGLAYLSLDGVEGHELRVGAALALPDGKLLFGGSRNLLIRGNPDPNMRAMLARMNADGSADAGFGENPAIPGVRVLDDLVPGTGIQRIEALLRLDDGALVAVGTAFAFGPLTGFVLKLDANGTRDASFGDGGLAVLPGAYLHVAAVDSRGRIVVAGERRVGTSPTLQGVAARFGADGRPDADFGDDGLAALAGADPDASGYGTSLALTTDDRVVLGGSYEAYGAGLGADFSLARFTADGAPDPSFAQTGWRVFHIDGDASTYNGVDRLALDASDRIVVAGHRQDDAGNVDVVLGRFDAAGAPDASFGAAATPGYAQIDVVPGAWTRYPSALLIQDDGRLLVTVSYEAPDKSDFVAFRALRDGAGLDPDFGDAGVVDVDAAPGGIYSDLTALTEQDGRPILAGSAKRDPDAQLVDLAAARLTRSGGVDDRIFADGFDGVRPVVSTYDDLAEGFLGASFDYGGVHYHDANGIGGVFPDGSTFTPEDVGDWFIVEDAGLFYADYPDFGSAPNMLTFGTAYMPGENFSIGALVQASLDLGAAASAVSIDLVFYENGPWGGIELHLDAYLDGAQVGEDSLTISDLGGRDDVTIGSLAISGVRFDSLKLYATYGGQPSAPRVMVDDLSITPAQ